eukprot:gene4308-23067_t
MINCEYVCDDYEPADCDNGADEDADFCAVWKGSTAGDDTFIGGDDMTGGDDFGVGGGVCEKQGDAGQWTCPGTDTMINCEYVCDDYEPADCDNGADEDADFCAVWKGDTAGDDGTGGNDDIYTGGDDLGVGGGVCEKQGDAGQWTCPGTDTMINCEYVCDDYEPADCDNGADEDADFCAVWNGGTAGDDTSIGGDDMTGGDDFGKRGDAGQWTCPGTDTMINCEYVCDDYEPADCDNGADEDADFCAVWKGDTAGDGGTDGNDEIDTGGYDLGVGGGVCEKQGDAGQWACPGTDTMINCEYVCDDYEPADCDNGADEDADFCAVWKGDTAGDGGTDGNDEIDTGGYDLGVGGGVCEKQGDAGQWACPGTDTMINCEYVCDDYEPADCDNGADEDADFCAVWNGGTAGEATTTTPLVVETAAPTAPTAEPTA